MVRRKIDNMANLNYWDRLKQLDIMSLQRRKEKLVILHTSKIKNKFVPNDLKLEFKRNDRTSAVKAILKPMPRIKGSLLTSYENSFIILSATME